MKDLALRRRALLAQAAAQRRVAAEATAEIRRGFASVERAVGIARYLVRKPLVVAAAVAAVGLLVAKPRKTATWLGYAVTAYTMFRRARRVLSSTAVN
jgi:hypothetical protein